MRGFRFRPPGFGRRPRGTPVFSTGTIVLTPGRLAVLLVLAVVVGILAWATGAPILGSGVVANAPDRVHVLLLFIPQVEIQHGVIHAATPTGQQNINKSIVVVVSKGDGGL